MKLWQINQQFEERKKQREAEAQAKRDHIHKVRAEAGRKGGQAKDHAPKGFQAMAPYKRKKAARKGINQRERNRKQRMLKAVEKSKIELKAKEFARKRGWLDEEIRMGFKRPDPGRR